ncbi:hypothetical protein BH10BAC4_BH10BAC4_05580 [soil metagenome]
MLITIKKAQFQLFIEDEDLQTDTLGGLCAKKLKRRLDDLRAAKSLEELRHAPGFYKIVSDKKGHFSCNLDEHHSLLLESHTTPIPKDINGEYNWSSVQGITIVEIISLK